jgi:hypothetical protein
MDDLRAPIEAIADATNEAALGAPEAPAAAPATPPAVPAINLEMLVEDWWREHFPGSAVGRFTDGWNVALKAKDELKKRLVAALS